MPPTAKVLTAPEKPGEPLRCEEVNNTKEDRQKWRLKYKWDSVEKKSYVVFEVRFFLSSSCFD